MSTQLKMKSNFVEYQAKNNEKVVAVDLLPLKFKSPPPKPPRRRYSDQLSISSSTLPGNRKKCSDEELNSSDSAISFNMSLGFDSLPADWTANFVSNSYNENISPTNFTENNCNSTIASACKTLPLPSSSVYKQNETDHLKYNVQNMVSKSTNSKLTPIKDTCHQSNILRQFVPVFSEDIFLQDDHGEKNTLGTSKVPPVEIHKRHHSDPMLSFIDKSRNAGNIQKWIRRNSFLCHSAVESQHNCHGSFINSSKLKEMEYLQEELNVSKEINDKLWHFLCSTQECLESALEKSNEENAFSVSDLLSSLYYAQKSVENAMEERMNIILEERDIAVQDLDEIVHILTKSFHEDQLISDGKHNDKEIKDLLKEIEAAQNPGRLLQLQRLLLAYLFKSKQIKQNCASSRLKQCIIERDSLSEKVKHLMEELKNVRLCSHILHSDNKHWENSLLDILSRVIHQRDIALSAANLNQETGCNKQEKLQVEKESQENRFKYVNNLHLGKTNHESQEASDVNCEPSEEVNLLKDEIVILSKALELEVGKREEAERKCTKLERLVNVLQRKIYGLNIGIPT